MTIHAVGASFPVQFVWQLPGGDYLRAVFDAEVLGHDRRLDRYLVRLVALKAGRQEDARGKARTAAELDRDYWARVGELIGARVHLAYETADGRPLPMRLATLTGEHSFFTRLARDEPSADE